MDVEALAIALDGANVGQQGPLGTRQSFQHAIASTGAVGMAGMGKVMAVLKPRLAGRADMGAVSARIKAKLAG